jgi:nucleoside 2-deoxyribosyltransferase
MKIYFAGPLFTPYVRQFISEHAQILRENGIEPFVPHEQPFAKLNQIQVEKLIAEGLVQPAELAGKPAPAAVMEMIRAGRLTREQAGLPPITPESVFDTDYDGLSGADAVLAILDGTQVDDGTACEIGIFHALMQVDPTKKGIVGLVTDSRATRKKAEGWGLNLFVLGILEDDGVIVDSFEAALAQLKAWAAAR